MRISGAVAIASALLLGAAIGSSGSGATAAPAAPVGDPVKGKLVFMRCTMCHSVKPGVNQIGPSLAGVVGRKAGSARGFAYSPAMKGSGRVWTPAALDQYLAAPAKAVPGNKMIFGGLAKPEDRADVVAYLRNPK